MLPNWKLLHESIPYTFSGIITVNDNEFLLIPSVSQGIHQLDDFKIEGGAYPSFDKNTKNIYIAKSKSIKMVNV